MLLVHRSVEVDALLLDCDVIVTTIVVAPVTGKVDVLFENGLDYELVSLSRFQFDKRHVDQTKAVGTALSFESVFQRANFETKDQQHSPGALGRSSGPTLPSDCFCCRSVA